MSEISHKWDQRYKIESGNPPLAARILNDYSHLLPSNGLALDLACGLGGNALFLAKAGLSVHAWDISGVAIKKLGTSSSSMKLPIQTEIRDVVKHPPKQESFDVIVVSYFLDRSIIKSLCGALRPDGLLYYQTFTRSNATKTGPKNPDYLLSENELLRLFSELNILVYREEGHCGNLKLGLRNEALLVGQKRRRLEN